MAKQEKFIDKLFDRIQSIKGKSFLGLYENVDADDMRDTWRESLGGFTPGQVTYAVESCKDFTGVLDLPVFIAFCRRAPRPEPVMERLAAPPPPPEVIAARNQELADAMAKISQKRENDDGKNWAREVVARWEANDYKWPMGYAMACEALGIKRKPRPKREKPDYKMAAAGGVA
jgi:hypothetical protein